MSLVDGLVFAAFLAWVVIDGLRQARRAGSDDPFLAGRNAPWWVLGLSVMATQASAITMVGTTGKGWESGTRFVQYYYALPLAMLILAVTLVPRLSREKVTTVYEYLGRRFDHRVRVVAALLFTVLRTLSLGAVIAAAAVVVGTILGVPPIVAAILTGVIAIGYTSIGGFAAVLATDVKQMGAMAIGAVCAFVCAVWALPDGVTLGEAWELAGSTGRTVVADWSFDPNEKYTIPAALLGGTFLFLSYFGCDQSQAQRLLAGRSERDVRGALLTNAILKVPFQFLILSTGVLLFAVYTFHEPPVSFVPDHRAAVDERAELAGDFAVAWGESERAAWSVIEALRAGEAANIDASKDAFAREQLELAAVRSEARAVLQRETAVVANETNFVVLHFAEWALPLGIAGLLFAAIFAAALSSIDSELNALTAVYVVDLRRAGAGGGGRVRRSRIATVALGAVATGVSIYMLRAGALIEVVNQVGSYFYGPLLGIFVLAFIPWTRPTGALVGLVGGLAVVGLSDVAVRHLVETLDGGLPWLYLNTIGVVATLGLGLAGSAFGRTGVRRAPGAKHRGP